MSVQLGLCSFNNLVVAAWKGPSDNDGLLYAQFIDPVTDPASGELGWTNLGSIPGASSVGPSLAAANDQYPGDPLSYGLYAAWKGESWKVYNLADLRLFFSSLKVPVGTAGGASLPPIAWENQVQIPGALSFFGPSLAVVDAGNPGNPATLVAVWAGASNGTPPGESLLTELWSMTASITESGGIDVAAPFPGQAVAIPGPNAVSTVAISVTVDLDGTTLYAAWSKTATSEVYYSTGTLSGSGNISWSTPVLIPGINSNTGVSLFAYDYEPNGIWCGWADATTGALYFAALQALLDSEPSGGQILVDGALTTTSYCPAFAVSQLNPEIIYVIWVGDGGLIHFASSTGGAWTKLPDVPGDTGPDYYPIKLPPHPFPIHFPPV